MRALKPDAEGGEEEKEPPKCDEGAIEEDEGSIEITAEGTCTIEGGVTASENVYISAPEGSVEITGPVTAGGSVTIEAAGDITITGPVTASGGDATLDPAGDVTVTGDVTASEAVSMTATSSVEIAGDVTAEDGPVEVTAEGGSAEITGAVTAETGGVIIKADEGDLKASENVTASKTAIFYASEDVSLAGVEMENSSGSSQDVRIFANQSTSASDPFEIGTSDASNGVAYVHSRDEVAGSAIYISNGEGTGGITYSGDETLQVVPHANYYGIVLQGGPEGTVTLSGTLSVDCTGGDESGVLAIIGAEVIANNATVSSSCPGGELGFINIITPQVTDNGGLTFNVNGTGPRPAAYVDLSLKPAGSYNVTAGPEPSEFVEASEYMEPGHPLTITGPGELTINGDGEGDGVSIQGSPLSDGAPTAVNMSGRDAGAFVNGYVSGEVSTGPESTVTLGAKVQLHANTTAAGQAPGEVEVAGTSVGRLADNVLLDASGENGGAGGEIALDTETGDVSLGTGSDDFTLDASGSGGGGAGGEARLEGGTATEYTVKEGDAVTVSAQGGDGDGGRLFIQGDSLANKTAATTALSANASGKGDGGTIELELTRDLTVGSGDKDFTLEADADEEGDGGEIEIYTEDTLDVSAAQISAEAKTDGDGGRIDLDGEKGLKISGDLSANAEGEGEGGSIFAEAPDIKFDAAEDYITANGAGSGAGGEVTLDSDRAIKLATTDDIKAEGGADGEGGSVTIEHTQPFEVEHDIQVEGDDEEPGVAARRSDAVPLQSSSPHPDDGEISLNGVTCGQWMTHYKPWPKSYWDCAHPTAPTAKDLRQVVVAEGLQAGLQSTLGQHKVVLFAFASEGAYNAFFAENVREALGVTTFSQSTSTIYTAVFVEEIPTENQVSEVAAHELGHAVDISKGTSTFRQSEEDDYLIYTENDFLNLDYVNPRAAVPTIREPCHKSSVNPNPPFEGTTLCEPSGEILPAYRYSSNSTIVQRLLKTGIYGMKYGKGWAELYAQAFAYEAYLKPERIAPGETGFPIEDQIFANNQFQCTRAWARALLASAITPPGEDECDGDIPSFYSVAELESNKGVRKGPPTLLGVEPKSGSKSGGESVKVYGTGFLLAPSATTVEFGSKKATAVTCAFEPIYGTECTVVTPSQKTAGIVNVTVKVGSGGTASAITANDQYEYR